MLESKCQYFNDQISVRGTFWFHTTWAFFVLFVLAMILNSNNNIVLPKVIAEIWEHINITEKDLRLSKKHRQSDDHRF